jgi:DNA repair protein RAD7
MLTFFVLLQTKYTIAAKPGPGFLCHKCAKESGADPFKKPATPRKRKVPAEKRTVINFEESRFPTLASLCIKVHFFLTLEDTANTV